MFNNLIKIDRIAAWILLIGILLYFISGFAMVKGIISPALATQLHMNYLTYIVLVAFIIHSSFAVHLAFKRWKIWNTGTKTALFLFYILLLASFFYIDKLYQPAKIESAQSPSTYDRQNNTVVNNANDSTTATEKSFTTAELARYDGQNGQPAYVAVNGTVYDVSRLFTNGQHFGHQAGQELGQAFFSRHIKAQITKYPVVGKLL